MIARTDFLPAAPLPVTRETPFRATGDIPVAVWEAQFRAAGSRITGKTLRAMHAAATGVQALMLDRLRVESFYGTNPVGRNNVLGVRPPNGVGFMDFPSPVICVQEIIRRWADLTYKNGVYGPQSLSIEGMLLKYSPPFENDTEALIRACVANINDWREQSGATGGESGDGLTWDPMSYPRMVDAIVEKPAHDRAGFFRVAARGDRIEGVCDHITDGDPGGDDVAWYRAFFGTGGERAWNALVDIVIGRRQTGLLNDWRDPNRGGTRAGWANGGEGADTPQGRAFYAAHPDINDVLVSKEHVTVAGRALNDYQIETSAQITAAVAHNHARCPWYSFPRNASRGNLPISLIHTDFAAKRCPAEPFISTHRPVILARARELLTRHQTGSSNPSPPEAIPPPPPPAVEYPFGFGEEAIAWFFGTLTRWDGQQFGFDRTGVISLLWLARCREEGRFPEAESWVRFGEREVVQWEGGWTAIREGSRGAFTWIDKGAPSPKAEAA